MERYLEAPEVLFQIGPIPITETIVNSWGLMLAIVAVAWVATRRLERLPGRVQNLAELVVEGVRSLVATTMGEGRVGFTPYMGALAVYLFLANAMGVLGLRPPTSDLNVTLGMALLTFVMIHMMGFQAKKIGYLKDFARPLALFLPLNIIGEIAKPVSLSFRLFGNILGGAIILAMVHSLMPVGLPVPLHLYFDIFVGLLQSFIFVMLTMVFVALAME